MDAADGPVPAPRHAGTPRLRRLPTAAEIPHLLPGEDAPRVLELHALLGDIDALRMTLQTDLTLAAAAVEAGADDLAAGLVDSDLTALRSFAGRASQHLARLDDTALPADEVPVGIPVRRRRVLAGAALMAAAAALIGFVALAPTRGGAAAPDTTMTSATMAGYELSRLASEGAPDEQLRRAAQELNDELAVLIEQAADDPAAARQALLLLEQTTEVLSSQGDSGVLRTVMAQTQALRARLRETLPVVAQRPSRAVRPVLRLVPPLPPRVEVEPEKERTSSSTPSSKPSPKASPAPQPSPSAAAPSPSPAPEPSPVSSPSPGGSPEPDGPLPQPDERLPGL